MEDFFTPQRDLEETQHFFRLLLLTLYSYMLFYLGGMLAIGLAIL